MTLQEPYSGAVYQRGTDNNARIPIVGTSSGSSVVCTFTNKYTGNVVSRIVPVINGTYNSSVYILGGWYDLKVTGDEIVVLDNIGAGEVFILFGHSYISGGHDVTHQLTSADERVRTLSDRISDQTPQYKFEQLKTRIGPFGDWPDGWGQLGDKLTSKLGVPVMFYQCAYGGSNIRQSYELLNGLPRTSLPPGVSDPNTRYPFLPIELVMDKYISKTGVRAMLVEHGYNDGNTDTATFVSMFRNVFDYIRNHWSKPNLAIMLVQEQLQIDPTVSTLTNPPTALGLQQLINSYPNTYQGVDFNRSYWPNYFRDHNHLYGAAIDQYATDWNEKLDNNFFNSTQPYLNALPVIDATASTTTSAVTTQPTSNRKNLIIIHGNSLARGATATSDDKRLPRVLQSMLGDEYEVRDQNLAVDGQSTAEMIANGPGVDNFYEPQTYHRNILFAWEITNSLFVAGGRTAEQAFDEFKTYCLLRKAKGWTVVIANVLKRTSVSPGWPYDVNTFEVARQKINGWLATQYTQFADYLVDMAALNVENTVGWDGLHPSDEGQQKEAIALRNTIWSIDTPVVTQQTTTQSTTTQSTTQSTTQPPTTFPQPPTTTEATGPTTTRATTTESTTTIRTTTQSTNPPPITTTRPPTTTTQSTTQPPITTSSTSQSTTTQSTTISTTQPTTSFTTSQVSTTTQPVTTSPIFDDAFYFFEEVPANQLVESSYTLSMDILTQDWISFHDWIPDYQFSSRNRLYTMKDQSLYIHNIEGLENYFYDTQYVSSISPVFISPKEVLEKKVPFMLNTILVSGSIPSNSWLFNKNQTSEVTEWIARDTTKTLRENYDIANAFYEDNVWQFNDFRNSQITSVFLSSYLGSLNLLPNSTERRKYSNRLANDHVVVKLTYGTTDWYFSDIGYNVTYQL